MAEVVETGFQSLDGIFWGLGLHPHARLQADRDGTASAQGGSEAPLTTAPRKQASRHVRCTCPTCGYVVRTTRK